LLLFGLPAPLTLGILAFSDLDGDTPSFQMLFLFGITLAASLCWEGVARWIWGTTTRRFGQLSNRQPPRTSLAGARRLPPAKPINAILIAEEHLEEKPRPSSE